MSPEDIGNLTLYQARMYCVETKALEGTKKMSVEEAQQAGLLKMGEDKKRVRKKARRKRKKSR